MLHISVCVENVQFGFTVKDKTMSDEDERKKWAEFTTHVNYSVLHAHIIRYPPGSMIPLWIRCHPVAKTETEGWLRGPYPELLSKWSSTHGNRTIQGWWNSLRTGHWVFSLCALRMELDILGFECAPSSWTPAEKQFVLYAPPEWVGVRVYSTVLYWLPKTSQLCGSRRTFTLVLAL